MYWSIAVKIMGSVTAASITTSPLSVHRGRGFEGKGDTGGCIFVNHVFSCTPDSDRIERSQSRTGVPFTDKGKRGRLHKETKSRRSNDMNLKTENSSNGFTPEINLDKLHRMAAELILPGRSVLRLLNAALEFVTNFLARVLGSSLVRRHFHLLLSAVVLFGPLLSFWVSKYNIFANSNHYVYRKFLRSTWGWTCIFSGSFIALLSLSAHHPLSLCLRHLSRVGLAGLLWWGCWCLLTLLEDAAGTCYEPMNPAQEAQSSASPVQPLLLLHEDQNKASCLKAHMLWRGYEVSQDVLILCFCCLLLVEEMSVFVRHLEHEKPLQRSPGTPLRVIFLLCVVLLLVWVFLLLCLLAYFPKFPSQQLGGALGYLWWRGLYQGLYRLGSSWGCPGLPAEGLFTTAYTDEQPQ